MRTAVILSTYNQPVWLEKVLWGYAAQNRQDFDIIIADDGSGPETAAVIERAAADFGDRLHHVWHEDRGFRKCRILNHAIRLAEADYLVFSDGDCIPRHDFMEAHIRLARRGHYLSGGVIWLSRALGNSLTRDDIETGRIAEASWLRARGWRAGHHRLRLVRNRRAAAVLDRLSPTNPTFNGHNASVFRDVLLEVNGFDNTMVYGGLDRALGYRLLNHGLAATRVRFRAVTFHLDHDRGYRTAEGMARNRVIRERIVANREVRAADGIAELAEPPLIRGGGRA